MKKLIRLSFLLFCHTVTYSQQQASQRPFLRIYADNDAFVPSNNATDWGYTSGIRIDLFYRLANKPNIFNWFNNLAGTTRTSTNGWGIMQTIIAPKKTSLAIPDKHDYPYAGALFATHTIHSANNTRKLNLVSEWIMGLMGPPSFGKQTQSFFHRLIKDPQPMGWDFQLPADLLLNYNIKAEKQLSNSKIINVLANGAMRFGSMNDGFSAGIRLQTGNNKTYFSGLAGQFFSQKKPRLMLSLQASTDITFYNALLEGGLFNKKSPMHDSNSKFGTDRKIQRITGSLDLFLLFSLKKFSISASQKFTTSELKAYGQHTVGNISFYAGL